MEQKGKLVMDNKVFVGICAFNHDSSVCVIRNNEICFAEEERFTHMKHTSDFPVNALKYCLEKLKVDEKDDIQISYYFHTGECWKNYFRNLGIALCGKFQMIKDKRFYFELVWLLNFKNKINTINQYISGGENKKIQMVKHHLCHALYAYYESQFSDCIVLSNDSMGEQTSVNVYKFTKKDDRVTYECTLNQKDPHSIGYLYGAVTEFLGFKRGSHEGKIMALASFGTDKYIDYFRNGIVFLPNGKFKIKNDLVKRRTFRPKGKRLSRKFYEKFGQARKKDEAITQKHYDIAYALQKVSEEIVCHQIAAIEEKNIVLTGGVALNSVINGVVSDKFPEKNFVVPPIPNDAGCSIGAALYTYYCQHGNLPKYTNTTFVGSSFTDEFIMNKLKKLKMPYQILEHPIERLVSELSAGKVVALFRGGMESGPRALCHRSIVAAPELEGMRDRLNKEVKFREEFRPYGGFLLEDDVMELLEYKNKTIKGPNMSFVYTLKEKWREKIPSLCHTDNTCRVQIIEKDSDIFLEILLQQYKTKTGIPILINTSLNMAGFPIARTMEDALMTFALSDLDMILFNERVLISK